LTFYNFYTLTSPFADWCFTFSGLWLLTFFALTQMELLSLFSALSSFLTPFKIKILQVFTVLVHFASQVGLYAYLGSLGRRARFIFQSWLYYGPSAFALFCALYDAIQTFYLLWLLYHHFQATKKETIQYRVPRLIRFAVVAAVIALFDIFGVILYAFVPLGVEGNILALEILHIRIFMLVFMFIELRSITVAKDQIFSNHMEQPPVKMLNDLTIAPKKQIFSLTTQIIQK
jgi:hypothetical protein